MNRWLLPSLLLLLAFGCGRKETPEAVVQILPAVVAEPEETQEPEPVRKPAAAPQPAAAPDTSSADAKKKRVRYTDDEYKGLRMWTGKMCWPPMVDESEAGTRRTLTGEEVERKGGIFEAVKTLPGVSGW